MKQILSSTLFLIALVMVLCLNNCYKESDYDPAKVPVDSVITELKTIQPLPLADGTHVIPVLIKLNTGANDSTKVLVTTSSSVFSPSEVNSLLFPIPIDTSKERQDTISLKAPSRAGIVTIKAKVGIYERSLTFRLETAPIVSLNIELPGLTINPSFKDSFEIQIRVNASRPGGKPSVGESIDSFQVYDPNNTAVGYFRNVSNIIDADRKIIYNYRLGESTWPNGTILKAKAFLNGSTMATADLIVYKP